MRSIRGIDADVEAPESSIVVYFPRKTCMPSRFPPGQKAVRETKENFWDA